MHGAAGRAIVATVPVAPRARTAYAAEHGWSGSRKTTLKPPALPAVTRTNRGPVAVIAVTVTRSPAWNRMPLTTSGRFVTTASPGFVEALVAGITVAAATSDAAKMTRLLMDGPYAEHVRNPETRPDDLRQ